jgi:hypothetical protein
MERGSSGCVDQPERLRSGARLAKASRKALGLNPKTPAKRSRLVRPRLRLPALKAQRSASDCSRAAPGNRERKGWSRRRLSMQRARPGSCRATARRDGARRPGQRSNHDATGCDAGAGSYALLSLPSLKTSAVVAPVTDCVMNMRRSAGRWSSSLGRPVTGSSRSVEPENPFSAFSGERFLRAQWIWVRGVLDHPDASQPFRWES